MYDDHVHVRYCTVYVSVYWYHITLYVVLYVRGTVVMIQVR